MHILTKRHEAVLICTYRVKLEIERKIEKILLHILNVSIFRDIIYFAKREILLELFGNILCKKYETRKQRERLRKKLKRAS